MQTNAVGEGIITRGGRCNINYSQQVPQEMLHVVNILDLSTNRLVLYDIQVAQPFHYFESILCLNVSMNMLTSLSGIAFCRHLKVLPAHFVSTKHVDVDSHG